MSLAQQAREVFSADGPLSRAVEDYRPREGQIRMAQAVGEAIEEGHALVVEAGTGVGKTYAYLVPALLSGDRVLISTATKALQDQLFGRDLPGLVRVLGLPVRAALLKGRGSYLCLHRMEQACHGAVLPDRVSVADLSRVQAWSRQTRWGDLAELPDLDERSPVVPLVTSTRENCLGAECPRFRDCHVNLARRNALQADVVVINHHLFFADLSVRESGMAELLPSARVVVFDEAHKLNETGVQFMGEPLSSGQLLDFVRDLLAAGLGQARGLADWHGVATALERCVRDLRLALGRSTGAVRLSWLGEAPDGVEARPWRVALASLRDTSLAAQQALRAVVEISPDFQRLDERAGVLARRCERFAAPAADGRVRWVDVSGTPWRLMEAPLDIADSMATHLLPEPAAAGQPQGPGKAWIFTSATLGDDPRLRWFTEPCGLQSAEVLRVDSPFDYARQSAIYVPADMPRPADPSHPAHVARLAGDAAAALGGRTLVLTTTLRSMRSIGDELERRFGDLLEQPVQVLVQGQQPKRVLIDRFMAAGDRGAVLVASASFWEGIDLPGDVLQLVVIDKLPFPPPDDPQVEARSRRLEQQRRNPFSEYSLPEAAIALKQGAGRLIRRETDAGILVVCDPRLVTMSYGRRLIAALPPMRRLVSAGEFEAELTRIATRPFPSA
ncbi:MAG: ATP-dependent DNA helicase [Burkholderiales bacterium]|jgi:ATP-dependent DNA helicase DinG|nr:ATP-dependent DNA helicase [Burkholderiales bacterium]